MAARLLSLLLLCVAFGAPASANDVNVSPVLVDYGEVKIGTTVTVRVVFSNLTAQALSIVGGGMTAPFAADTGTCSAGVIPASSSCYYNYSFRPTDNSGALFEGATSVSITGGSSPETQALRFRGRGTGNLVDVAWADVDFGDWFVGEQATVRLRILNTHTAGIHTAGGGFNTANGFGGFGCGLGGDPLPPGDTCDFVYTFLPPATGFRQNTTAIQITTDDTPFVSQLFPLHVQGMGIATVPLVGITPVEVDFGEITIGRQPEVPVDYTNFDTATLSVAGGGFSDNDDAFFGFGSNSDPCTTSSIASGDTCTIDYSFRPTEERAFAAGTSLLFSKTGEFQSTPLSFSGNGIGTLALVSPVLIDFGDVEPGTQMTVPVVIQNTSEAALTSFVGGGVLAPFSKTSDSCGSSLAVGASCQFDYRFTAPDTDPASAETLISFTNSSGIQPAVQIRLYANGAPEPGPLALGVAAVATLAALRRTARS